MKPKNCFKITENFNKTYTSYNKADTIKTDDKNDDKYETNINNNLPNIIGKRKFKLSIVKKFEFNAKFQSTSVIVKNHLDNSLTFNIKGAPDKIIKICKTDSLPNNLSDKLSELTQAGLRVFACASKHLPQNINFEDEDDDFIFENNLKFLGLIIFRNKLKKDTKDIISKFNKSNIKIVISTGDNVFTTISVANESEIINKTDPIFNCKYM